MGHPSWIAIIVALSILIYLTLSALAVCVALFVDDRDRRSDAYRVLKVLLSAGGGSGLIVTIVQLASHLGR